MQAEIHVSNGSVLLHDKDTGTDQLAMTPTQASWLSHFLQQHLVSELVVQLRLAAKNAEDQLNKTHQLKRN